MSKQEKPTSLTPLQSAALLVEKLQTRLEAVERARTEPIAVIGMGCRLPGGVVDGPSYWQLLRNGVDAVRDVPPSRWDTPVHEAAPSEAVERLRGFRGGFLDEVSRFDADFFGISPREVATMDPQQRLLLEVMWEALENAGQASDRIAGSKTGVFVGITSSDYMSRLIKMHDPACFDMYSITGNGMCFSAGRMSYVLGLHGPSMPVDTACSSSLVAVHLACESLRTGDSSLALAGGVSLMLAPDTTVCLLTMQVLSPDGKCKTFDAAADGYVRGEGCGVLVLKRLSDAERDGDNILALIRGSAVSHDGASGGLMVPSGPAQQAVVQRAIERAGIDPALVSYVEAHGTGTPLGDPIELRALGAALGKKRPKERPFFVGSVKTNIGHLEPAAGIAGIMKVILALQHKELPPHLNFRQPNPHIEWDRIPAVVPTQCIPWPAYEGRRIAGVNSFGLSGTNAHVVLEEAPAPAALPASPRSGRPELVVLSAKTSQALTAGASELRSFLKKEEAASVELEDMSYTAALGRTHHDHRISIAAKSKEDLAEQLDAFLAGESRPGLLSGRRGTGMAPKVAFVMPGQGSQWQGMGARLYAEEPVFREAIDRCQEAMRPHIDWSLREVLTQPEKQPHWHDIDVVQPTLFAMQVALAAVWRSLGVEPDAVVGHSMGEVAAAHIAGALGLDDAARIICGRSKLLRRISGKGAMALVDLSRERAQAELQGLEDRISIAVSNSSTSTVLSGDPTALKEVMDRVEARGIFCRWVKVDVASHSPQVDPLREELLRMMASLQPAACRVPLYSTVSGAVIDGREFDARYWVRNLREPVLFADAVRRLMQDGHLLFIELSPHPILVPSVEAMLKEGDKAQRGIAVPSMRRDQEDWGVLLSSLGGLYTRGYGVDFRRLHPTRRRWAPLPTYRWQRERHWLDLKSETASRRWAAPAGAHPLLGAPFMLSAQPGVRFWQTTLSPTEPVYLADYKVGGAPRFPASACLEMALAAAHEVLGEGACELVDTSLGEVRLPEGRPFTVQTTLGDEGAGTFSFEVSSRDEGAGAAAGWTLHAAGRLRARRTESPGSSVQSIDVLKARCGIEIAREVHYEALSRRGAAYGPAFQGLSRLWRGPEEALGRVELPKAVEGQASAHRIHPALLEACFQLMEAATFEEGNGPAMGPAVPVALGSLRVHERPGAEFWCHVRLRARDPEHNGGCEFDVLILDDTGRVLAELLGLRTQRLAQVSSGHATHATFLAQQWQRDPTPRAPLPEPRATGERWLLLGSTGGLTDEVERLLRERHEQLLRVELAGAGRPDAPGLRFVDPTSPEAFDSVLAEVRGEGASLRGVIYLASADAPAEQSLSSESLERALVSGCAGVLHLTQALSRARLPSAPRLWLVTRGAHGVHAARAPIDVSQAPLWGLGRTLAIEHPEFRCTRLDLSAELSRGEAAVALVQELLVGDTEDEIALCPEGRYVGRLAQRAPNDSPGEARVPAEGRPFRLELAAEGRLGLRATLRRVPGPGEVELEIDAVAPGALDGRPVRHGVPGRAEPRGFGSSGRVVAVGEGVQGIEIGHLRVVLATSGLGSHVTLPASSTVACPASLSAEQAAAIPATYLPAWYALQHLGRLQRGERVLIYAAASGAGLAAVRVSQKAGATLLVAAETPEQRASLHELGIEHVLDPADGSFVGKVMAATGGHGADLVILPPGSTSGEQNPPPLADGGRVLDLRPPGARGRLGGTNVACYAVDLPDLASRRVDRLQELWREVIAAIEAGQLPPPSAQVVPVSRMAEALRQPGADARVGESVLAMKDPEARIVAPAADVRRLRAHGTYLITGGLGPVGLSLARWMVEQGARHLVLVSHGAETALLPAQQEAVAALETAEARVVVAWADLSDRPALARVLDDITARMPPLRGVVHAAGVVAEGMILEQSLERFRYVLGPKAIGAWNLHLLTASAPLDFFVLYASAASLFGGPGQSNYAAASAFLDGLAHHRRMLGLPGLSIDWLAFADTGQAAPGAPTEAESGSGTVDANRALGQMLDGDAIQLAATPLDPQALVGLYPNANASPRLSGLIQSPAGVARGSGKDVVLLEKLRAARPEEGLVLMEQFLRQQLGHVLRRDPARLDGEAPLQNFGLDSLMGLEFRNRLEAGLAIKLPASLIWKYPTLAEISQYVFGEVTGHGIAEKAAQESKASESQALAS
ncbi:SDR family NAD(P)-dependent oxidoreductase [Archangium sp.]|uniref:SDR family NAD(P)-dependent oxidoreductase n=1 Tax=Archangium sp. TaxID=1872627 RepID=UPI002D5CABA5|nr:SDR family NAD(P)-dependent oxidoreductase [Archangium sp.]HYO51974.1 SDR family NAD(P)-dependent oxidoreductase [Archangium sp.]